MHEVGGGVLRVSLGRVNDIILACAFPKPFEVTRKRSGVGVGEDVVQLRNDVSGVILKRLLRNYPVCHSKQQSVLVEHVEGGEGSEEQTERIKLKRSLGSCFKPGQDSP